MTEDTALQTLFHHGDKKPYAQVTFEPKADVLRFCSNLKEEPSGMNGVMNIYSLRNTHQVPLFWGGPLEVS